MNKPIRLAPCILSPALCKAVAIVVLGCYATGCSVLGPRYQTISVTSDPAGAKVNVRGNTVGVTPLQFNAHRGKDLFLEVKKPGYLTQTRASSRTLSALGILDLVGGLMLWIPLLGLLSAAAWKHDPEAFSIILEREKTESLPKDTPLDNPP
jgi:hypothetical protein